MHTENMSMKVFLKKFAKRVSAEDRREYSKFSSAGSSSVNDGKDDTFDFDEILATRNNDRECFVLWQDWKENGEVISSKLNGRNVVD